MTTDRSAPGQISLVMPNRNHGKYLSLSIGAMLAQLRPADEIIIIDDNSVDDSISLIRVFQKTAPQIHVIARPERLGVVANLNSGLSLATGDYIAFPGADDRIYPDFLRETAALLDQHPLAGLATGRVAIADADGSVTGYRPIVWPAPRAGYVSPIAYRRLLRRGDNHFLGAATLYRRQALMDVGGFDASLGSMTDGVAARRIAARHGFCFSPNVLGLWRNQGGNYSMESATHPQILNAMIARAAEVFQGEPKGLFDEGYAQKLAQRMRFGGARLLAQAADLRDAEVEDRLAGLGLYTWYERAMIRAAGRAGGPGRLCLLAWLFLRFRPMALTDLLHAFVRSRGFGT